MYLTECTEKLDTVESLPDVVESCIDGVFAETDEDWTVVKTDSEGRDVDAVVLLRRTDDATLEILAMEMRNLEWYQHTVSNLSDGIYLTFALMVGCDLDTVDMLAEFYNRTGSNTPLGHKFYETRSEAFVRNWNRVIERRGDSSAGYGLNVVGHLNPHLARVDAGIEEGVIPNQSYVVGDESTVRTGTVQKVRKTTATVSIERPF